jgi:hypothetical protein
VGVFACGEDAGPWDVSPREDTNFATGKISNPRSPFATGDETVVKVNPQASGYELPLSVTQIVNLDRDIRQKGIHDVGSAVEAKLAQNGFVVVSTKSPYKRFSLAYDMLKMQDVPVLVTADSVLHLYHLFFDQILKYLEVTEFSPILSRMLSELIAASLQQQKGFSGTLKEAARRNVAYLSVAAKLLDPSFSLPSGIPEAQEELTLIDAHKALRASPLMNHDCPKGCDPCGTLPGDVECQGKGACTCEDYTQYIPRGHYTVSEGLKRYFKAMMWLGRIGFRIRSDMESVQAVLLTDALNRTKVDGTSAAELWYRIYDVTGFLVGASDDLTFFEYQKAVQDAFGDNFDMADLTQAGRLKELKDKLEQLRDPGILGGFLSAFHEETELTKGWRLMGQRFAPDSYVLGQMVWDHIGPNIKDPRIASILKDCNATAATCQDILGDLKVSNCICFNAMMAGMPDVCRLLPKGLDVMAVLGSKQAEKNLAPDRAYCGFDQKLQDLQQEFAAYTRDDWRQSVYWYWLDVLKPLLGEFSAGYPNWMRTEAWATKELNTTLTSWAELRHDTILYVKQSYTPAMSGTSAPPPEKLGMVEPVPRFFAKLKDLADYTRLGLEHHKALPEGLAPHMRSLVSLLQKLTSIAIKELEGKDLDQDETNAIKGMGGTFSALIEGLGKAVTVEEPVDPACEQNQEYCIERNNVVGDPYKTTIVADVHTDVNSKKVLEVGSGYLDWIIVARQLPDGTIAASVGPVFSYYEFPHPMNDRLTDEAWGALLGSKPPDRQSWISDIRVP